MSTTAPGAERRRLLAAAGLLTAGFLALWLLLPDRTFVFDGMMFSDVIERRGVGWRDALYNPRHLLFNPTFQLLRDALASLGVPVGAYRLVQIVNALAGAAGLWMFFGVLRRLLDDYAAAMLLTALLGASWAFGTRATEGQVYMLLGFGGLWTLRSAAALLDEPTRGRSLDLAAAFGLTTLFHAGGACLAPAVFAALWLAFPSGRARMLPAIALASVLILVPYAVHFSGHGTRAIADRAGLYSFADSNGYWTGLLAMIWTRGEITPWGRLLVLWNEASRSFAVMPEGAAAAALGASLWVAAAGAVYSARRTLDARRRNLTVVLAAAWAGCAALNAFWLGGIFFGILPAACLLALVAAGAGPRLKALKRETRRRLLAALGAFTFALGAWNALAGLWPQSLIENNPAYDQALYLKAHTVPTSCIVIAGVINANLKVYIPSVAGRARAIVESYFMTNSKGEGLQLFASFIESQTRFGIPLYLLDEVVGDPKTDAELRRLWGITSRDLRGTFGPGSLLSMARRPDLSLYLFVPRDRRPELFVGLGYSVLTEMEDARRKESAAALGAIARQMTAAEKRRTGELLRSSGWGFALLLEGYAPLMDADNRKNAEILGARFIQLQRTADFWLRAGNLYELLGLKREMTEAWTVAQKISGDKNMLKSLQALRQSK